MTAALENDLLLRALLKEKPAAGRRTSVDLDQRARDLMDADRRAGGRL